MLARLAGFLASHLPADEDPLRQVIDALMLGYGEAERLDQAHDHEHDHHHGRRHPGLPTRQVSSPEDRG